MDKIYESIKDNLINTIKNLSPEINLLNTGDSMDRIINKVKNCNAYYKDQINTFTKNNDILEVIVKDVDKLKQ